jgi:hypothetical protein
MRKILLLISLVVLPAAWMFAQYGSPAPQYGSPAPQYGSPAPQYGSTYETRHYGGGGNRVSVEGCLFGEPGNLALLDDNGNTYELRGRTRMLRNYIGHRVRVDGRTWFRPDNPFAMSEYGESTPILRVTGTRHVSRRHCEQWGGSETEFRFTIPLR